MRKFGGLVKNEYVKILKRVYTWVMVILLVLSAAGLVGILRLDMSDVSSEDINSSQRPAKIMQETKSKQYKTYFEQNDLEEYSWQAECAAKMHPSEGKLDTELYNKLDGFIQNDDWKGYYTYLIQQAGTPAEEDYATKAELYVYQYRLDNNLPQDDDDYFSGLVFSLQDSYALKLEGEAIYGTDRAELPDQYQKAAGMTDVLDYMIQNKIRNNPAFEIEATGSSDYNYSSLNEKALPSMWYSMSNSTMIVTFASLLIIIVAGSILANEFSQGTIKFLLINPVGRRKILVAKYTTLISVGFFATAMIFLLSALCSGLFFGFDGITQQYIWYDSSGLVITSPFWVMIKSYLFKFIGLVMTATIAFAVSSLFKSSAFAIAISMFAMFAGDVGVQMLKLIFHQDWARYTMFANMDLQSIISHNTMFMGQTVGFAVAVLVVHWLVLMWIAWDGFVRREI